MNTKKKALLAVGGIFLLIVVALLALPFLVDVNHFKPTIEAKLQQTLGRPVQIGELHLSLLAGGVSDENVVIGEDPAFGSAPFLTAKSLDVGVNMLPLILSRSLDVNSITLREPELRLVRGNGGKWNFSSLGTSAASEAAPASGRSNRRQPQSPASRTEGPRSAPASSAPPNVSIGTLRITDGKILVSSVNNSRAHEYSNVQLKASNISYTSVMPFNFEASTPGGGSLKADGKAGPLDREDTAATPLNATVGIKHLDIASTGFVDPSSGIAGLLDFDGSLQSNGKIAETKGKASVDKLRLVRSGTPARQPVNFDYATQYDLKRQQGSLQHGAIQVGKAAAALAGNYAQQGEATVVHMKFIGNNMPVQEVQGLLPAFGVVLPPGASLQGGTINTNLGIDGPLDHLVITGPLNVANTRLTGFNLLSKMSAIAALAGVHGGNETDIQTLASGLRVAPEGIRADNLNLIVPALGTLTGAGTIGANNALDFKMVAKLVHGGGLLGGISALSTLGRSQGELPFMIKGTTSNPIFVPDVGKAIGNSVTAPAQGVGGLLNGLFGKKNKQPR